MMTVDELLTESQQASTGPLEATPSLTDLSGFLRLALQYLLEDVGYATDPRSNTAVAMRIVASVITACDEAAERRLILAESKYPPHVG